MPPSSHNPEATLPIAVAESANGSEAEVSSEAARDRELLDELWLQNEPAKFPSAETGLDFANGKLADMAKESYGADDLQEMETLLKRHEALSIPTAGPYTVLVGGESRHVTIVPATEIGSDGASHGDMSSMLYLRDQVQAASALMELNLQDEGQYGEEGVLGHNLLISALDLMSTESQLKRLDHVVAVGGRAGQEEWPHISLHFNDLEGKEPNGWRNKQDTMQMLAYASLDAIERGFIRPDELSASHKHFLGSIVPFLEAVGYPMYENSGSWEEVTANRTSVMAIETALLGKIKNLVESHEDLGFLQAGASGEDLSRMIDTGLREVGRRLPFESGDEEYRGSVKYREADAALVYVLMYGLPKMLTEASIPIGSDQLKKSAQEIENVVLDQLETLIDPETNAMLRYVDDSYQRTNFHTHETQFTVNGIKKTVKKEAELHKREVDLDRKQQLRGDLTPQGKEAAWTHPLGQVASWAAEQALLTEDGGKASRYIEISTRFLNRALSTVTGEVQWNAALDHHGQYQVRKVTPYRMPECYITYARPDDTTIQVPSPHTPLNWSSAMLKQSIGLLKLNAQDPRSVAQGPELVGVS